jgi:hypothetical protein
VSAAAPDPLLAPLVRLLPLSWQPRAKAVAILVVTALTVASLLTDVPDWVAVVIAVIGPPAVWGVPNLDPTARHQDQSVTPPPAPLHRKEH